MFLRCPAKSNQYMDHYFNYLEHSGPRTPMTYKTKLTFNVKEAGYWILLKQSDKKQKS